MQSNWQPIAITKAVKAGQLYQIWLDNHPWVLFRDAQGQARLLNDICPHRLASLSSGKIIAGEIQCPYHGWQFNHLGMCMRIPGLDKIQNKQPLVKSQNIVEAHGMIWAANGDNTCAGPSLVAPQAAAVDVLQDVFFLQVFLQCDLLTLVENFLDGFHTHFIHAGLIRHDQTRQSVSTEVRPLEDGIEVIYQGETNQNGFLSRWFEANRGHSCARFRLPNFAEIEYRSQQNRLNLLVSLWAVAARQEQLSVIVRVATQQGIWPAWIKNFLLRRFALVILKQDQQIVENVYKNKSLMRTQGLSTKTLNTELDLLHPWLEKMINSKTPQVFDRYTREIRL